MLMIVAVEGHFHVLRLVKGARHLSLANIVVREIANKLFKLLWQKFHIRLTADLYRRYKVSYSVPLSLSLFIRIMETLCDVYIICE